MYISCLDRGKKRDRARMGEYNRKAIAHKLETAAAEIKELDEEADRLCNTLENIVADKKKQDFHLRLLKDEVERRKTNPLGFRLGPSPQEVKEKREREAEEKAKEEHRMQEQRERRLRRELAERIAWKLELVKEKERRVKAGRGHNPLMRDLFRLRFGRPRRPLQYRRAANCLSVLTYLRLTDKPEHIAREALVRSTE